MSENLGCNHEWVVFSTSLQEGAILVECANCGAGGTIDDPNGQEWSKAFKGGWRWEDEKRVNVRWPAEPGRRRYVQKNTI